MNNPHNSHPLYQSLGNPPNIQLLDTMFQMQPVTSEPHGTLIPGGYATYTTEMQLAPGHQAMNLAQAHVVNDIHGGQPVIIYQQQQEQQQQQQQPISYKIPQMEEQQQAVTSRAEDEQKKKDIVAEATSEIFDENAAVAKKSTPAPEATSSASKETTAIKSEPTPGTSGTSKVTPNKTVVRTGGPVSVGGPRGGGGGRGMQKQQILPRLQLLEEEDDGLTCRMCLQCFWYKSQLIDHLKANHSINDPERYEREEREKKMRRIREEQQRQILAKRQRMAAGGGRGSVAGLRGRPGRPGPGGRPGPRPSGPRPSFQYRDGAFICDLCKKSFSDGNDMVTHWKSHVKKQRLAGGGGGGSAGGGGGSGRRGRPPVRSPASPASGGKGKKGGRSDKGKPRWTAYLVWSTRRRKEISEEEPDWTFGEIAKAISAEWKEVSEEDKDRFQHQAEQMNYAGVRKMFKAKPSYDDYDDHFDSDIDWSADEDPDFEEKIIKPIMLKIKKEGGEDEKPRSNRKRKRPSFFQEFENEENNLDKILDEFEQEQMEEAKKPKPEKSSDATPKPSGTVKRRRRKKEPEPEPEEEEPIELEKSRSGRIRKKPKFYNYFQPLGGEGEEAPPAGDSDDEDSEDRDEYQPDESEPEEDVEINEDEVVDSDESTTDDSSSSVDGDGHNLPPKKRRQKKIMSEAEIEEFTRRALKSKTNGSDSEDESESEDDIMSGTQNAITITKVPLKPKVEPAEPTKDGEASTSKEGGEGETDVGDKEKSAADAGDAEQTTSDEVVEKESTPGNNTEGITTDSNEQQEQQASEPSASNEEEQQQQQEPAEVSEPAETVAAAQMEGEQQQEEKEQEPAVPANVEEPETAPAAEASEPAPSADDNDLLSQMEDGDDKFKDIIAEGQMDQIFQ